MGDIAVRVEGLGKRYRIGSSAAPYGRLTESMWNAVRSPFRRSQAGREPVDSIWALKDVSMEVRQGEVVGIIGRNGAGKTTLLKILSRITEPTEGVAVLHGRVGSLLEVGTGFHPELTGRENVFLNGAILGMRKGEIERRFDEIVAFAEVERFIDTPVKHYSSGMYVRLAFAVAAHLEPQILIVDEVLAVGDIEFQKRCLGRMGEVARTGRTVLFVSHNMSAVLALCDLGFLLERGEVVGLGAVREVVDQYLRSVASSTPTDLEQRDDRGGDGSFRFTGISIQSIDPDRIIRPTSRLSITLDVRGEGRLTHPQVLVGIYDLTNTGIYLLSSEMTGGLGDALPADGRVTCVTAPINLTPGRCFVNVALSRSGVLTDHVEQAAFFDVQGGDGFGFGKAPTREWVLGVIEHEWSVGRSGAQP